MKTTFPLLFYLKPGSISESLDSIALVLPEETIGSFLIRKNSNSSTVLLNVPSKSFSTTFKVVNDLQTIAQSTHFYNCAASLQKCEIRHYLASKSQLPKGVENDVLFIEISNQDDKVVKFLRDMYSSLETLNGK